MSIMSGGHATLRIGGGPPLMVDSWMVKKPLKQRIIETLRPDLRDIAEDLPMAWFWEVFVRNEIQQTDEWDGTIREILEAIRLRLIPHYLGGRVAWSQADYLAMSDLLEEKGLTRAAEYLRRCGRAE